MRSFDARKKFDCPGVEKPVVVFMQTTDAGPDQAGARRLIGAEVGNVLHILHLTATCKAHQGHIAYTKNLLSEWAMSYLGNTMSFSSTESKVTNIWRELGKSAV